MDHAKRATSLASATPGSRHGEISATVPGAVTGLDTLTFWGHGDSFKLCGKNASDIVKVISKWKSKNSKIKTVELITCNARHCSGGDSFANQVKSKFGIMSGTRGITLKALPVTVTGKNNAWSILLAETNTKSWVYVTAPGTDDKMLMSASGLINFTTNATGGLASFNGDIAKRADETVRTNPDRKWTMNYGYFNTLRACLVKI